MMQSHFPNFYIIVVRSNYLTGIYVIRVTVMRIIICTPQCCQNKMYIIHYFTSIIKLVPVAVHRMIINIFEKQLKQIAKSKIMLVATHEVGNNAMSLLNTCYIRQVHILEPNR